MAVTYLLEPDDQSTFFHPKRSEGTININSKNKRNKWSINAWGAYHSISIIPGKIKGKEIVKHLEGIEKTLDSILDELLSGKSA